MSSPSGSVSPGALNDSDTVTPKPTSYTDGVPVEAALERVMGAARGLFSVSGVGLMLVSASLARGRVTRHATYIAPASSIAASR